jgi:hypothetical protein
MSQETITVSKSENNNSHKCICCKKLLVDTIQNVCCCVLYSHRYFNDLEDMPMSMYTCKTTNKACNGDYGIDDVRCCCFVFTPITFALDLISCPFRICHYIHKKRVNGGGIPCYTRDPITSQPK